MRVKIYYNQRNQHVRCHIHVGDLNTKVGELVLIVKQWSDLRNLWDSTVEFVWDVSL